MFTAEERDNFKVATAIILANMKKNMDLSFVVFQVLTQLANFIVEYSEQL